MTRRIITTLLLVVLTLSGMTRALASPHGDQKNESATEAKQEADKQRAQQIWEQAVAAKGGRERLYAVRNILVSWRGNKHVDLYAFPDKLWRWMDDRPSPIGLAVEMHNLGRNLSYLTYPDDPKFPRKLGESGAGRIPLRDAQLYFLLETEWIKPTLLGATSGHAGLRAVDTVQTRMGDTRVDFYLDRRSHLPLKITFPAADERGTYYVTFSDYTLIDGIQMPRRVSYMGGGWLATSYQVNVSYDESIFERPPSIEAGAEAWKPKH